MRRVVVLFAVLLAVGALLAGCGSDDDTTSASGSGSGSGSGSASAPAQATGEKIPLTARDFSFSPTTITLTAGKTATIQLKNDGENEHNLTIDGLGADKDVEPGDTVNVVVTTPKAGSYAFHCEYHPDKMKGTVTVS